MYSTSTPFGETLVSFVHCQLSRRLVNSLTDINIEIADNTSSWVRTAPNAIRNTSAWTYKATIHLRKASIEKLKSRNAEAIEDDELSS